MSGRGIGLPGGKRTVIMPEGSGLPRPRLGLPSPSKDVPRDAESVEQVSDVPVVESLVSDGSSVPMVAGNGLPIRGGQLPGSSPSGLPSPVAGLPGRSNPSVTPVALPVEVDPVEVDPVEVDPMDAIPVKGLRRTYDEGAHETGGMKPLVKPSVGLPGFRRTAPVETIPVREPVVELPPRVTTVPSETAPVVGNSTTELPRVQNAPSVPMVSVAPVVEPSALVMPAHGGLRSPKRRVLDESPLAGSSRWDDASVPDPHLGLNAEVIPERPVRKKKVQFSLTERDIAIITLCARYRFAYREQIQHYFQSENIRNRLTRLADEGLLRKDMVTQNQALWLPMQAGLDVADLDLSHIERGRYSATSIAHSIGLLNLGIEFEKGWENLLMEDVWPNLNRPGGQQGEVVITEREITNSFNQLKGIAKGDGKKTADIPRELQQLRNDAMSSGSGMETRDGMAGLFVGYHQNKSHTPDMVIARPRNADGSSNHIAIELELNAKPIPDWIRILRAFKNDPMYKSVVYFTHKRTINNRLTEINRLHVGLSDEQFKIFKYTPRNNSIPFWG